MKRYRLCLLALLFVLVLWACNPEPKEIEPLQGTDWLTEYASYIQKAVERDNIPGLALAIVQRDEIILTKGYGWRDIAKKEPVTPETLFHIGSTHKSMTSMLIATLVDDGIVDWDEPVINLAPEFVLSDSSATQKVTMRHLLSMRSGIPDEAEYDLPKEATPQDVFRVISETPLLGMPGEKFSYSNLSASVGGYLGVLARGGEIENLYVGYAGLLQEKILDPIGMETATIYASKAQENTNYSLSYTLSDQGTAILSESYDFDGDALAPSGSLKANVIEMALYVATQLNRGVALNGTRVVSAKNLEETWQPYLEEYGMGWEIQEHKGAKIILHGGAYDDFASIIGFLPEFDIGFVILLNSEEAGDDLISTAPFVLVDSLRAR